MTNYITDEIKALIGCESEWEQAWDPVERGQIRRHVQAVMDPDPAYWDDDYARTTKAGQVVAPPLFPIHALRERPDEPDAFAGAAGNPDFDGATPGPLGLVKGLAPVVVPLKRVLNGGSHIEICQLAVPGEYIRVKCKYLDIYQREGRTGPLVFVIRETLFTNQKGELLVKSVQTRIFH